MVKVDIVVDREKQTINFDKFDRNKTYLISMEYKDWREDTIVKSSFILNRINSSARYVNIEICELILDTQNKTIISWKMNDGSHGQPYPAEYDWLNAEIFEIEL